MGASQASQPLGLQLSLTCVEFLCLYCPYRSMQRYKKNEFTGLLLLPTISSLPVDIEMDVTLVVRQHLVSLPSSGDPVVV